MGGERGFLVPENYVLQPVTTQDLVIASLALGFTMGIGWLTAWTALKQTTSSYRRIGRGIAHNAYVVMIWGEIVASSIFAAMSILHLFGTIRPSFEFYFFILTSWVFQVQFLLQIIINRCAILVTDRVFILRVKWGTAALITMVNISVYCIWIPARLQISERYIHINEIWDRCEKVIYLIVDAALNFLFMRIVRQDLVKLGLRKYNGLVKFNIFIIGFSLSMDVLIIAMMSLKNTFVYMQFHPLAYIVKLKIEMSMANLIAKIAKAQERGTEFEYSGSSNNYADTMADSVVVENRKQRNPDEEAHIAWVAATTEIQMNNMKLPGDLNESPAQPSKSTQAIKPAPAPAPDEITRCTTEAGPQHEDGRTRHPRRGSERRPSRDMRKYESFMFLSSKAVVDR
ncbi:unnamed protein product [Clonostachys rosea]|uniref:Uncharacterized protein n=1 Tax=Bionectria ochroleuca TaxID=29856 RepID=A0ABY6U3S5_BIOOC|nr:unnamed protein product [Clonostachys rosea]